LTSADGTFLSRDLRCGPGDVVVLAMVGAEQADRELIVDLVDALDREGFVDGCPAVAEALAHSPQLTDTSVGRHGDLGGTGSARIEFQARDHIMFPSGVGEHRMLLRDGERAKRGSKRDLVREPSRPSSITTS
jgi:hypothetical protein